MPYGKEQIDEFSNARPSAFPWRVDKHIESIGDTGPDLRDIFAGQALQAYLTRKDLHEALIDNKATASEICEASYMWADTMMEARGK
jgi:hypothetical protein